MTSAQHTHNIFLVVRFTFPTNMTKFSTLVKSAYEKLSEPAIAKKIEVAKNCVIFAVTSAAIFAYGDMLAI